MSEKSNQKNYDLLLETFALLKKKLAPYSKKLIVHTDEKEKYGLVGDKDYTTTSLKTGKTATKHGMHFVDLIIQKGYVGFYFMCAYTDSNFMQEFSEELQKRRKGKSCFYFKKPTEVTADFANYVMEVSITKSFAKNI